MTISKTISTGLCALILATGIASGAAAIDFKKIPQKPLFKDLPGVTMPEDELTAKNACTTELIMRPGRPDRSGPIRVYVCKDGDATFMGTTPPDEYDWRQTRKHLEN